MTKDVNSELDKLAKAEELKGAPYFKFAEPGDFIQGTLVTSFHAVSSLNQPQIVYVIRNEEGVHNVGFKDTYPIHREFAHAVAGQIVRITHTGTKPHAQKGYNPIKLYSVVTRPDLMDADSKEYLAEVGIEYGSPLPERVAVPETEAAQADAPEARPVGGGIPKSE